MKKKKALTYALATAMILIVGVIISKRQSPAIPAQQPSQIENQLGDASSATVPLYPTVTLPYFPSVPTIKTVPIPSPAPLPAFPSGYTEENLVSLVNAQRVSNGLKPLVIVPSLTLTAKLRVQDMVAFSYFSHESPDGKTFDEIDTNPNESPYYPSILPAGVPRGSTVCTHIGENLAFSYKVVDTDIFWDAHRVVLEWMNSPAHRANILDSSYTDTGIYFGYGKYQGHTALFVAQQFGGYIPCKK